MALGVTFFPKDKLFMKCDMFIWEASKEWASDLAEMIKFPGTCKVQNSLYFFPKLKSRGKNKNKLF